MIRLLFDKGCPNCGGLIDDERVNNGLPCYSCLPISSSSFTLNPMDRVRSIYGLLVEYSNLRAYWRIYDFVEQSNALISYFKEMTSFYPWGLQSYWIRRFVEGESFSMSAPTGLGKSTTLMVLASYVTNHGGNVYYITPTRSLAEQTCKKLNALGVEHSCNEYSGKRLTVTTFQYINSKFDRLKDMRFDLVAVDDADAIIRSGKTTERVAKILGISDEVMAKALMLVKLRTKYRYYKVTKPEEAEAIQEEMNRTAMDLFKHRHEFSQLIVASATARPKGSKQEALKYALGFEPSTIQFYMRNVVDSYASLRDLPQIVERVGKGGLILVSKEYGRSKLREIKQLLSEMGVKAELAVSGRKFMEGFSSGEVDVLIGTSSYYGVAVRGLDEPLRLRYVVFYGVPKNRMRVKDAVKNPLTLIKLSKLLKLEAQDLEKRILDLSPLEFQTLRIAMRVNERMEGKLGQIQTLMMHEQKDVLKVVEDLKGKVTGDSFVLNVEGKEPYLDYPDPLTYIQGTGRSSRLLNGKLTKGLSVTLIDDEELYKILLKKLSYYVDHVEAVDFRSVDLNHLKREMESSRTGEGKSFTLKTSLLVVESPTKAKTIAKMFGSPVRRYIGDVIVYETIISDEERSTTRLVSVVATRGHITDLTLDEMGEFGVMIEDDKISPIYSRLSRCSRCRRVLATESEKCFYCEGETIPVSSGIIDAIRKIALEVDEVLIATDPDIEGEKIAYDVQAYVKPYNPNVFRVKYHAVTKDEIVNALRNMERVNRQLVEGQVLRRIEDRWIGFHLSKVLKAVFETRNHGAGRVQTPVLGWVVKATLDYKRNLGWIVTIGLPNLKLLEKFFRTKTEAQAYLDKVNLVSLQKLRETEDYISPPPPFTTDTLLIETSLRLHLSPERTMALAQQLFESGLITYHRTDSTHVTPLGMGIAKLYLERSNLIGEADLRSWEKEGTHEAIRPTRPVDMEGIKQEISENPFKYPVKLTSAHLALYDLIFRRFIASQMKQAKITYSAYKIKILGVEEEMELKVPVKAEGGFSLIFPPQLHGVPEGEIRVNKDLRRGSAFRMLNYPNVISMMRDKGIGRPSTYSKALESLRRHGYLIESKHRKVLIATKKGIQVYEYLSRNFPDLISETQTAMLLNKIDEVSRGRINASDVIADLREEILKLVNEANA